MKLVMMKSIMIISLIISAMPSGCYATESNNNFSELTVNDNDFVGLPGYDYIKSKNSNMKIITLLAIYKSIDKQIGSDSLKSQIWVNYVSNNTSKIINNWDAKEIYEHNGFYHAFLDSADSTITNLSTMSKDDLLRLVFTGRGEKDALNVLDTASIPKLNYVLNKSITAFHPDDYAGDLMNEKQVRDDIDKFYENVNRESARYDAGLFEDEEFNQLLEDAQNIENSTDPTTILNSINIVDKCINGTQICDENDEAIGITMIGAGICGVISAAYMVSRGLKAGQLQGELNQIARHCAQQQRVVDGLERDYNSAFHTWQRFTNEDSKTPGHQSNLGRARENYDRARQASTESRRENYRLEQRRDAAQRKVDENMESSCFAVSPKGSAVAAFIIMTLSALIIAIGGVLLNNSVKMKESTISLTQINERLNNRLNSL